jgi:hypothetical protein
MSPLALSAALAIGGLLLIWRFDPGLWQLPMCGLHTTTGLYCPGCGATRATHELLHGRFLAALQDNALWVLTLPLALYATGSECRYLAIGRPLWGNPSRNWWVYAVMVAAAVLFFVMRNLPIYPLVLLKPTC